MSIDDPYAQKPTHNSDEAKAQCASSSGDIGQDEGMVIDRTRQRLEHALQDKGLSKRQASLAIGRGQTYIQQYIKVHTPRELEWSDCVKLGRLLDIPPQDLTDNPPSFQPAPPSDAPQAIDKATLREAIIAVRNLERRRGISLSPGREADAIIRVYGELIGIEAGDASTDPDE